MHSFIYAVKLAGRVLIIWVMHSACVHNLFVGITDYGTLLHFSELVLHQRRLVA